MSSNRNVYLQMKTLREAREILFDTFSRIQRMDSETVPTPDAVGRVLAQPAMARLSSPNYHSAAMDGIAVDAETTFGARETRPKELMVGKEAFYLNTGHVMPPETNAVIMIEHVNVLDENRIEINAPVFPWQNVRKVGEDVVATELIFPRNHMVTPYCVGALLSGGLFTVPVQKKPNILIIPTGSELVDWQQAPNAILRPGQILETNAFVLGKMTEAWGGMYHRCSIQKDDPEEIKTTVLDAINGDFDMVLTIGGSSAGSEDHIKKVLHDLGNILVHGITIMPGKPLIIGKIKEKPVFGIPGYPVSAIIAFEQFVGPLICKMVGQPEKEREKLTVEPTRNISSKLGLEEFVRVKIGMVGNRTVATQLPRGAGIITSITEADGIIRIPNHVEGIKVNDPVTAELLHPMSLVANTIVAVGSHDNSLDILSDMIKARYNNLTLSSSHVGSMGGLMAIKKGVCHLAGSHLLDTKDGTYNTSYIKKFIPEVPTKQINLVFRDQGLILPRGNPKGIKGIEDFTRQDITIINRQAGSGTRILLDYKLNRLNKDPAVIKGYQNDEFTHMAVAVAVLSGAVDVGLGIYSAAKALDLDFIPVIVEQYDLIIPEMYFDSENIKRLMDIITSDEFKIRVQEMGGYSTEKTGVILN